jgi:hypothetical protein
MSLLVRRFASDVQTMFDFRFPSPKSFLANALCSKFWLMFTNSFKIIHMKLAVQGQYSPRTEEDALAIDGKVSREPDLAWGQQRLEPQVPFDSRLNLQSPPKTRREKGTPAKRSAIFLEVSTSPNGSIKQQT